MEHAISTLPKCPLIPVFLKQPNLSALPVGLYRLLSLQPLGLEVLGGGGEETLVYHTP